MFKLIAKILNFLQLCHQYLNILHNFDLTKLVSDLYLVKFLDISIKLFFPCIYKEILF